MDIPVEGPMDVPPAGGGEGDAPPEYSSEAFKRNLFFTLGMLAVLAFVWFLVLKKGVP